MTTTSTTRRAMLAGVASVSALALTNPAPAVSSSRDPIYDAIERHAASNAACIASCNEQDSLEEELPEERRRWHVLSRESLDKAATRDDHRWLDCQIKMSALYDKRDELAGELVTTMPTTPAGVATLLAYAANVIDRGDGTFPETLPDEFGREVQYVCHVLKSAAVAVSRRTVQS